MGKPKVKVDPELCVGSGTCVEIAQGVFKLNDEDKAEVVDPTAASMDDLREAEESCPVGAISVEESDE